jgi:MFS family permease
VNPFATLRRHRNFRFFWTGQTVSLVGTWMQGMAIGWLALELSNSAFIVGLVAAAGSLPILLFSLPAGVLADRTNKLRTLRLLQLLMATEAALLWWFTWSGNITISWLVLLAAANGIISAFEIPVRQALVIDLVGRQDLSGAIALNSSGFNLARVVGPSIGALVIAKAGIAWCFGINTLSYVAVLGGLQLIRLPAWVPPVVRESPMQGIVQGVRYMRDTPAVNALMQLVLVFSVMGIPFLTLMPVVARDRLGLGAGGYGLLLACVGLGGLAGALSLAAVGDRFRRGRLLAGASVAFAGLLLVFAFTTVTALAAPLLFAVGFAMIVNNALSNAMLQSLVPDALRGRMMAAYSFVVVGMSQVFGAFLAGAIARTVGVGAAIGVGAVVMLVYAWKVFSPRGELRRL